MQGTFLAAAGVQRVQKVGARSGMKPEIWTLWCIQKLNEKLECGASTDESGRRQAERTTEPR